jgi:hypothetical protein
VVVSVDESGVTNAFAIGIKRQPDEIRGTWKLYFYVHFGGISRFGISSNEKSSLRCSS